MTTEPLEAATLRDPMLLQVILMPQGKRVPMMMEVPVSRDLDGPFVMCSSKGLICVESAFASGNVRTAVRVIRKEDLFQTLVPYLRELAGSRDWGSVHPGTPEGVVAAFSHLADYDIIDVEVVYGTGFSLPLPEDVTAIEAAWVPAGCALVLPTDRSLLGTVFEFESTQLGLVVHNAPRGVAFIKPTGA